MDCTQSVWRQQLFLTIDQVNKLNDYEFVCFTTWLHIYISEGTSKRLNLVMRGSGRLQETWIFNVVEKISMQ